MPSLQPGGLEAMHGLGVETIYGRTSNPGVIHIGQSVGRRLRRIVLRRDGPFISPDRIASLLA